MICRSRPTMIKFRIGFTVALFGTCACGSTSSPAGKSDSVARTEDSGTGTVTDSSGTGAGTGGNNTAAADAAIGSGPAGGGSGSTTGGSIPRPGDTGGAVSMTTPVLGGGGAGGSNSGTGGTTVRPGNTGGVVSATTPVTGGGGAGGSNSGTGGTTTAVTFIDPPPFVQPTMHPFISLVDYDVTNKSGPALTRLKAQVDDVVKITSTQPANSTYTALMDKTTKDHYGYSCVDAIVLYYLTQDTTYLKQSLTMTDAFVNAETASIAAGTNPIIAGDSYLDVGSYMEQISLAYDYGYDMLTPAQRQTWEAYANQAIENVWNPTTAKWGSRTATWSGWAIDDPGDNYYYSFTKATLLWAIATQNTTLLDFMKTKKIPQMAAYFGALKGGGSREGTGYGTALASLFENYRYWRSSTGDDISKSSSHAKDTIDYWLHATVPTLDYFASIGDQSRSSMTSMFDYQRHLVVEAVRLNPNTPQGARGAWWLNHVPVIDSSSKPRLGQMAYGFDFRYDLLVNPSLAEQAPTDLAYYAEGAGVVFARSGWTSSASWIATVAGTYDQSHAHQDQGSFTLYKGTWLAATANLVSRSGLHSETSAHNVLRFEDSSGKLVPQANSTSTLALSDTGGVLTVDEDLSPAYAKSGGAVSKWTRKLVYTRSSHSLEVHDTCAVGSGVKPVFQVIAPVQMSAPTVNGPEITWDNLKITQVAPALTSSNVPKVVELKSLDQSDFSSGYRIELTGADCEFKVTLEAQ
jgi:hypothetical protein